MRLCSTQPAFTVLVEEWKDCEELRLQPKEKWTFMDQKREGMKHQTEWCVQVNKYRCMVCGRSSKYMKMAQKRIVESRQRDKMLQDRGAFHQEEGDVVRE